MSAHTQIESEGKICDECGKTVASLWRAYKGHKYCGTCYARIFKRTICPQCGNHARLPRDNPNAICNDCENDKPCARCGRLPKYPIGKISAYGPVCKSCSLYFRPEILCEACGTSTKRTSKITRDGRELCVCSKCARSSYGTCSACRKYRVISTPSDKKRLCKKCLELGLIPCPKCTVLMPAGCGVQCENCQWGINFKNKLNIDLAAFSTQKMNAAFSEFGEWLRCKVGNHKAAISIHRYLPFFLDMERKWQEIPDYPSLLKHFGAHLNKMRLPMQWLQNACGILPNASLRSSNTEFEKIEKILSSVPEKTQARQALHDYHELLLTRLECGATSMRSIRLALSPALSLLTQTLTARQTLPDQATLLKYLLKSPGQRAAITGFINHLNNKYKLGLTLPKPDKKEGVKRFKALEAELLGFMQKGEDKSSVSRKWLSLALAYFHGLPRQTGQTVALDKVTNTEDGIIVEWQTKKFWIPNLPT